MFLLLKQGGAVRVKVQWVNIETKVRVINFANVECHYGHVIGQIKKYCEKFKRDNRNDKGKEKKW